MIRMIWAALAVAASGQAAAQETAPSGPVIARPDWLKRPNAEDLVAVWPAQARARGIDGRAKIRCEVSAEGTLRLCQVTEETPQGSGYGAAALALAPQFRMRPQTVEGRPVAGAVVNIPISFETGGRQASGGSRAPVRADGARYVTTPNWVAAPTRAQMTAAYPQSALKEGKNGHATVDCEIAPDGRLRDCGVAEQAGGFGRPAMSLTSLFRLRPEWDPATAPRKVRVRFPIHFSPAVATADAPQIVRPEWGRLPEAADVVFPPQAKAAGVEKGEVTLACRVQPGGALEDCSVARETPAGMGFAAAALRMAPSFVMRAWTSDGRPVDGARVRIPIRFEP